MRDALNTFVRRNNLESLAPTRIAASVYAQWAIREWRRRGEPSPPPSAIKRRTLVEYGRRFGLRTLVETGTYYGDTVFGLRAEFDRLISIELDPVLHRRAQRRFAGLSNVILLLGDSSDLIEAVIKDMAQPALFWLDAHYMSSNKARGESDTPISAELDAILTHSVRDHVILIDDARDFRGQRGYPELSYLQESILRRRPDMMVDVRHDMIRICPK